MNRGARGFTLLEVALVLVILSLVISGLALPLAAQVAQRRQDETRMALEQAAEALLGFAASHGRLPCPAVAGRGEESFRAGGDAANGACADFHGGYLPAAALGLWPLDAQGFLRDAWGHRIRYAVAGNTVGGVPNALTRANGLQAASLPAAGAASHYLFVCASGSGANAAGCGPAANQLTRRAAFVLVAPGPNGGASPGPDEARNIDGDAVFVQRAPATAEGAAAFDDVVRWVAIHALASRLVRAGRLP